MDIVSCAFSIKMKTNVKLFTKAAVTRYYVIDDTFRQMLPNFLKKWKSHVHTYKVNNFEIVFGHN